jgi:hypothetical protein
MIMTHVFDEGMKGAALRRRWLRAMLLAGAFGVAAAQAQAQAQGAQEPAQAQASAAPADATPRASEISHATLAWLDLQSSNRVAVPEQPMLGAAASLAYQRYLESFKSKIPVFFDSASASGSGGSGGGGSLTPSASQ